MIDCHILVMPDMRHDWFMQCVDSVQEAAERAGYPVSVRMVDAVVGHVGKSRASGYAKGSSPFVTYVDWDDYLLPGAFAAPAEHMDKDVDAIFSGEWTEQNGKRLQGLDRHHLCVYRREALIDHSEWVVCGDLAQANAVVRSGRFIDTGAREYVHRIYQSGGRALRRQHQDELRAARG